MLLWTKTRCQITTTHYCDTTQSIITIINYFALIECYELDMNVSVWQNFL